MRERFRRADLAAPLQRREIAPSFYLRNRESSTDLTVHARDCLNCKGGKKKERKKEKEKENITRVPSRYARIGCESIENFAVLS